MALTSRQRSIHNKSSSKRCSFNKGKRKASEGDIIVTSAPTDLRSIWYPGGALALSLLVTARLLAVYFGHIDDCDETYNYWEPLHYLIYGSGLQTWEYSPAYAIRSYTFLWIFGVPGKLLSYIMEPVNVFYTLKALLAISTAVVELGFYKAVCHEFGVHVGRVWLALSAGSAGCGAAGAALLPSALGGALGGAALACLWRRRYAAAVACTAANALLGWPFTAILGLPIAIDMVFLKRLHWDFIKYSLTSLVVILIPMVAIDSWYYGKLVIAPWNIVAYNMFTEHGPSLYGVEPWTYYFVNGFLNFNIVWVACLACPAALAWAAAQPRWASRGAFTLPYWLDLLPLYLWLAVFLLQPHKEQRFLYPVYNLIVLSGAICIDCAQKMVYAAGEGGRGRGRAGTPRHYLAHTVPLVLLLTAVASVGGISRMWALHTNYASPMSILSPLPASVSPRTVCYGKEWHRSPSSFHLPPNYHVRFIRTDFDGQMPAPYSQLSNATRLVPPHFNDQNRMDERTYLTPSHCHYLVDSDLGIASTLQPAYSRDAAVWQRIAQAPLLDAHRSHPALRAFYVPILSPQYTTFGTLYLLKNRFI